MSVCEREETAREERVGAASQNVQLKLKYEKRKPCAALS